VGLNLSLCNFGGAMPTTWMNLKSGRVMPFDGGLLCMAARLAIILGGITENTFMVSAFFFTAAISFLVPYSLSIYAEQDAVGRLVAV
jgi:hypothetical protein